jgi:FAD dependent oxidoreductase TIGR03364
MDRTDVVIVGAGIAGLAHAWMASRRGLRAVVLERTKSAEGASIRNFGMIWPIGQPRGPLLSLALRSRELWLELESAGVLELEQCGSIHLAHRPDELAVHEEFCSQRTHDVRMMTADEVVRRSAVVNPALLLGGMFSPLELRVNARTACNQIAAWLAQSCGVECSFSTTVVAIEDGNVARASDGRSWRADRIVVCAGADLQTLYPDLLAKSGLVHCKLQMLKGVGPVGHRGPVPHLASGLTLRHYPAFRECASLKPLQQRIQHESPELDQFGIHILASQLPNGEILLGDSHEYGKLISPFNKAEIDDLILREASRVLDAGWRIMERWSGVYCKHPELPVFECCDGNVHFFVGLGGAGITMSFALAERTWCNWLD